MEKDQTSEETQKETSDETATGEDAQQKTSEPKVDYQAKFVASQQEGIRLAKRVKELESQQKPSIEKIDDDLDAKIDQKVREAIAPLTKEQEDKIIDDFLRSNPEAADYLKDIDEKLPQVRKISKTLTEALENTFLLAKKDAMKQTGKKEMAFAFYQKEQASASGGAFVPKAAEDLPILTEAEKKVAKSLGIKEEAYAKRKAEIS